MTKKLIQRGASGFPIGIMISYMISIVISFRLGKGNFSPIHPDLAKKMGTEWNAVVLQFICSGLIGSGFSMASLIWEHTSWSLAKQSLLYFLCASIILLPAAYVLRWMPHGSWGGIFGYFFVFAIVFVIVWLIRYLIWKIRIQKINRKLSSQEQ